MPPFEIVPPEILARPFRHEMRRIERDLCALQLDPYLRRLASQEARCRRVLGTLARTFLGEQAHHALGFARLDDYARERLGLCARELQSTHEWSMRSAACRRWRPPSAGAPSRGRRCGFS